MYPQNYYQQQYNRSLLKGRPVCSIEEVKAAPIDFDGSISYFPDIANKKIYTKQINLDGTSSLNVYELSTLPIEKPTNDYVTREEFEKALQALKPKKKEVNNND